jgi:hypothetical protein
MALPSITTPTFKTTIPSTGQKIEFRPFLVKEEKILLMALEGGDASEMAEAMKKILTTCILDDVDVDKLATFDVEYLFLKLRAKSVGEVIELRIGHTGDNKCDHKSEVKINIDDIKVSGVKKDKKVMMTDDIGVVLHYPSMSDVSKIKSDDKEAPFKIIASCIDMVFDANNVYEEFTQQEMEKWLESLSQTQFDNIAKFFNDLPVLKHKVEWTCEKCGEKDKFNIEGLASFFMLL